MIAQLSKKIVSFFILKKIIVEVDREIYNYSFEILLSTILNFVVVIVGAIITKRIWETFFYLLGFIPIRRVAGGYHAKTHFRCLLTLVGAYTLFLLALYYIPLTIRDAITVLSIGFSFVLIYLLSPVEDKNKPFTKEEVKYFKKKSRVVIGAYCGIIILSILIYSNQIYILSLALGILSVSISLPISVIKNKCIKEVWK